MIGEEAEVLVRVFVEDPISVLLAPGDEDDEGALMLPDNAFALLLLPVGERVAEKVDFEKLVP